MKTLCVISTHKLGTRAGRSYGSCCEEVFLLRSSGTPEGALGEQTCERFQDLGRSCATGGLEGEGSSPSRSVPGLVQHKQQAHTNGFSESRPASRRWHLVATTLRFSEKLTPVTADPVTAAGESSLV